MQIPYTLEIFAPIEKVFECIDDDEKLMVPMEGLEEIRYPQGPNRESPIGRRFVMKIREGKRVGEYDGEVVAYEKPYHLGISFGNTSFKMRVDYRLTASDSGTRLHYLCQLTRGGRFVRLMGFSFRWRPRKILRKQMTALKDLAEREAGPFAGWNT